MSKGVVNYFPVLFAGVLLSVAAVVATAALNNPFVSVFVSMLPMFAYHAWLKTKSKQGLTQAAIDSVYYFGFLITIAALGVTALHLDDTDVSITRLMVQFGTGLLATGYAVVARMHLTSIQRVVTEQDAELLMGRYVEYSEKLVNTVEDAVIRTADFSSTIASRTEEIRRQIRDATERALHETTRVFADEIKSALAEARQGLSDIRGLVDDVAMASTRTQLTQTLQDTLDISKRLNATMIGYAAMLDTATKSGSAAAGSFGRVEQSADALSKALQPLGGASAAVASVVEPALRLREALGHTSQGLQLASRQLGELSEAATAAVPTLQKVKANAKRTELQIDTLTGLASRLDVVLNRFAVSTEKADATSQLVSQSALKLRESLRASGEAIEHLATRLAANGQNAEHASQLVGQSAFKLRESLVASGTAIEQLAARLNSLSVPSAGHHTGNSMQTSPFSAGEHGSPMTGRNGGSEQT